jgi:hypothetical protein
MARSACRFASTVGVVLAVALIAGGCGAGASHRSPSPRSASRLVPVPRGAVHLTLGASGRLVPRGFLGLSIEFPAIRAYTGSDPHAVNPVFEALVRGLSPGQAPVLRIGGDSTDLAYVPAPGVTAPDFVGAYRLTNGWLATTAALAHDLGARMTLGLNLAADEPALDAAEAGAYLHWFGRGSIAALEIGNEPNLYAQIAEFLLPDGHHVTARSPGFRPADYAREVAAVTAALPRTDPAWSFSGPALAASEDPDAAGAWTTRMGALLRAAPAQRTLTVHRYPLLKCFTHPGQLRYPTLGHLLSPYSTSGLASGVRQWVQIAGAQGRAVRVDELNSVACRGEAGVSNTFASALWATDVLFSLVQAGVAGVNVHTLPGAAYEPFAFDRHRGRWQAHVEPEYYGLKLFAQAAPLGSRLLPVAEAEHSGSLSVWATQARDGRDRLVLIDKDPGHARTVAVAMPRGMRSASLERMTAPSVAATGEVSLGRRTFGAVTGSGRLAAPVTMPAPRARGGTVVVRVPGGSAALVTFTR